MSSTGKASESQIADLHGKLTVLYKLTAEVLLEQLGSDDEDVRAAAAAYVSPALLTSMQNWCRMNNVTCQPEDTNEIDELQKQLAENKKRARKSPLKLVGDIGHING